MEVGQLKVGELYVGQVEVGQVEVGQVKVGQRANKEANKLTRTYGLGFLGSDSVL